MDNRYEYVKNIRKRMKEFSVAAMGGCCQICSYEKCKSALEFHHINPDEKDFDFGSIKGWTTLCDELEKCILLCCRCHREVHYGEAELPLSFVRLDRKVVEDLRKLHSVSARKNAAKANLETFNYGDTQKEEMAALLNAGISKREIGRRLGLSQTNVRFRLKKYGL